MTETIEPESDPVDYMNNVIGNHKLPSWDGDEKLKLYPCTCGNVCPAPPCFKCSELVGVPMVNVISLPPGSRYDTPMVIAICMILVVGILYIGWSMQRDDAIRAPAIGMMEAS